MSEDSKEDIENESINQFKKSQSVTFRLDSKVIDELRTEANNKEVSLNVLVNQVLKRYAEWDRYENKIGMIPVPRVILSNLIEQAISVAKSSGIKNVELYRDEIIKQEPIWPSH